MPADNTSGLSRARRRLVELMQSVRYGQIEGLRVESGEPCFDPPPRVVREVKLGAARAPLPGTGSGDFALKARVVELFALLRELGAGTIDCIELIDGQPFLVRWAEGRGGLSPGRRT